MRPSPSCRCSTGKPSAESVAALVAIYQAERADSAAILSSTLALLGAGVAYAVATIAIVQSLHSAGWWIVGALPFPLWLVLAYQSLLLGNAAAHERSTRAVEDKLYKISRLAKDDRTKVGSVAGNIVMNPTKSSRPHAVANYLTFGGLAAIIVAYTVYALIASGHDGAHQAIWAYIAGYVIIGVLVAASWRASFNVVK